MVCTMSKILGSQLVFVETMDRNSRVVILIVCYIMIAVIF